MRSPSSFPFFIPPLASTSCYTYCLVHRAKDSAFNMNTFDLFFRPTHLLSSFINHPRKHSPYPRGILPIVGTSTSDDARMAHGSPLFAVSMHRRLNHRCAVNKYCNFRSRTVPMQRHLRRAIIPRRILWPSRPLPPKPSGVSPSTDIPRGVRHSWSSRGPKSRAS